MYVSVHIGTEKRKDYRLKDRYSNAKACFSGCGLMLSVRNFNYFSSLFVIIILYFLEMRWWHVFLLLIPGKDCLELPIPYNVFFKDLLRALYYAHIWCKTISSELIQEVNHPSLLASFTLPCGIPNMNLQHSIHKSYCLRADVCDRLYW